MFKWIAHGPGDVDVIATNLKGTLMASNLTHGPTNNPLGSGLCRLHFLVDLWKERAAGQDTVDGVTAELKALNLLAPTE